MDDCDSFPHARCLQAFRSMAAHLRRQTQSRNAREAGWSGAYKVWILIISVNNKSDIALATSCILYILIGPERLVVMSHCGRKYLLLQVSQILLGLAATWLGPVKSYAGLIAAGSLEDLARNAIYLSMCNQRQISDVLDWEIFRLRGSSDWRLWLKPCH